MRRYAYVFSPESPSDEDVRTWANGTTLVRTIGGLVLFSVAAFKHSATWNFAGLALYLGLDVLDGYLARVLNQETRFGAQMDILSDRFLVALFYLNYLALYPELVVIITLFLFEFMILDHYLSSQFMRWPILSPNYFYEVDRTIWLLNWSIPGKFLNTGLVTILMLATKSVWSVLPVLVGLICVKVYSCVRLHRLPPPTRHWRSCSAETPTLFTGEVQSESLVLAKDSGSGSCGPGDDNSDIPNEEGARPKRASR